MWIVWEVRGWRPFPDAFVLGDGGYQHHLVWLLTPFPLTEVQSNLVCSIFLNCLYLVIGTVPCTSRANCARHMHHLLSVPILTIENYFHSQVTAFFMRTKKY